MTSPSSEGSGVKGSRGQGKSRGSPLHAAGDTRMCPSRGCAAPAAYWALLQSRGASQLRAPVFPRPLDPLTRGRLLRRWSSFAALADPEALAKQVGDQELEGSRKNQREVAAGMRMAEQVASGFELALQVGVDGELRFVSAQHASGIGRAQPAPSARHALHPRSADPPSGAPCGNANGKSSAADGAPLQCEESASAARRVARTQPLGPARPQCAARPASAQRRSGIGRALPQRNRSAQRPHTARCTDEEQRSRSGASDCGAAGTNPRSADPASDHSAPAPEPFRAPPLPSLANEGGPLRTCFSRAQCAAGERRSARRRAGTSWCRTLRAAPSSETLIPDP